MQPTPARIGAGATVGAGPPASSLASKSRVLLPSREDDAAGVLPSRRWVGAIATVGSSLFLSPLCLPGRPMSRCMGMPVIWLPIRILSHAGVEWRAPLLQSCRPKVSLPRLFFSVLPGETALECDDTLLRSPLEFASGGFGSSMSERPMIQTLA